MPLSEEQVDQARRFVASVREQVALAVIGQGRVIDEALVALIAAGHVLIEGLPGLGKTLLVRALARTFDGGFGRIQFTPDLMPADVVGHAIYDPATGQFSTRKGPVFTNLLLADEINRAPAKTQAALLEVMQEAQVTIDGTSHALPAPFMVLATQNPIEQEGTYPLPEAQLDRFLLKLRIGYPSHADEVAMIGAVTRGRAGDQLAVDQVRALVKPQAVQTLQQMAAQVVTDVAVVDYAVRIVRQTRDTPGLAAGAGSRGGLALVRAARAWALAAGRGHVTPDDIKAVALPALRHRVRVAPEQEIEGRDADSLLSDLLGQVPAPRQ
ncbi:MAG: AAA family ATPase [Burkholderiales bacterium]|nr:AAA family ATPase [Burkholderiales bacterium]